MNDLPNGWVRTTLGEVVKPRSEKIFPNGLDDVRFIGMDDIESHSSRLIGSKSVESLKSAVALFKSGDILYGRLRPYLNKVYEADFSGVASAEYIVLQPTPLILGKYLKSVLRSQDFVKFAVSRSTGDRPRVSVDAISEYSFDLPPINEQQCIASKLDNLFASTRRAREEMARVPTLIEHYKQAILAGAFRGDLTKEWREIHQAQSSDETSTQSETDSSETFQPPFDVPTTWRWLPFPRLGRLDRGRSRHRPRNDPRLFGGEHPFIQTGEVRAADGILTEFTETYSDFGLFQSRLWPIGTVCITIAANIAETAILGIEACFPDSVVGFIANDSVCFNRYIEYFLRTVKEDLNAFAPATAQKNINLGTLSQVYVPVPPRAEQDEIVRLIDELFESISITHTETIQARQMLDHLESAVLAKAFRGELVPQNPDDEPVSVLLERIRAEKADSTLPKLQRRTKAQPKSSS